MDQFHKSQNAPIPYPTMLHSEQKCAYLWGFVGYGTSAFWDVWITLIVMVKFWSNFEHEKKP